jgi:hypothetical protein
VCTFHAVVQTHAYKIQDHITSTGHNKIYFHAIGRLCKSLPFLFWWPQKEHEAWQGLFGAYVEVHYLNSASMTTSSCHLDVLFRRLIDQFTFNLNGSNTESDNRLLARVKQVWSGTKSLSPSRLSVQSELNE